MILTMQGTLECVWTYLKQINKSVRWVDHLYSRRYDICTNVYIPFHSCGRQNEWILHIFDIRNSFVFRQVPQTLILDDREVSANVHIMHIHALTLGYDDNQRQWQIRKRWTTLCGQDFIIVYWRMKKLRYVTNGMFKGIFVNINVYISTKISLKWILWFDLRNVRKCRDEMVISICDPRNCLSCLNELRFAMEIICCFVVFLPFKQKLRHWTLKVRLVMWHLFFHYIAGNIEPNL